jgi:hypothetical protein
VTLKKYNTCFIQKTPSFFSNAVSNGNEKGGTILHGTRRGKEYLEVVGIK